MWMPTHITDGNTVQDSTPALAPVPDSTSVVAHVLFIKRTCTLLTDQ